MDEYFEKMKDWASSQNWKLIDKIHRDDNSREYEISINGVKFTVVDYNDFKEEFLNLIAKYRV